LGKHTRGWEIGIGPSVVIVDKGMARSFSTDTLHSGIYAFTFDQQRFDGRPWPARLQDHEDRVTASYRNDSDKALKTMQKKDCSNGRRVGISDQRQHNHW
jgi:hypothetical protein